MLSFTRSGGEMGSAGVKEGDIIRWLFEVNTIDNLLIFTQQRQYYPAACPSNSGIQMEG